MRPYHDEEILSRWLAAERGQPNEADVRSHALFAALPALRPPAGFADRVLVRAGLVPAPGPARRDSSPPLAARLRRSASGGQRPTFWLPRSCTPPPACGAWAIWCG